MDEIVTTWWKQTDKPIVWDGRRGSHVYRCEETGIEKTVDQLPAGALRTVEDAKEFGMPLGADGLHVICRMPCGGEWHIDGRASNCTMPDDNAHRCWVRHGTFGDRLTVDKAGLTCAAGAGSIQFRDFHGFLTAGILK